MSPALALVIAALIQVESGGNPRAVGKAGEVGCLQITPAVIEDVNRIQKGVKFTIYDAENRDLSIQICRIYLEHYCSRERLKRDPDPRDYALVWHLGPFGYRHTDDRNARAYWAKVRAALVAQGQRHN